MNDMMKIRRALLDQGFSLKPTPGNHFKIYNPEGQLVHILGRNSTCVRGLKNLKNALRKAGAKV